MDRYRLGPLREVRTIDERAKRHDLAATIDRARASAAAVAAAAARVASAREVLARAIAARAALVDAHTLTLADRYIARRRRELDDAIGAHARTHAAHAGREGDVASARERLTAARADKELIERHFERWREAQRKLADRRED